MAGVNTLWFGSWPSLTLFIISMSVLEMAELVLNQNPQTWIYPLLISLGSSNGLLPMGLGICPTFTFG
jgi:hypothetical protein